MRTQKTQSFVLALATLLAAAPPAPAQKASDPAFNVKLAFNRWHDVNELYADMQTLRIQRNGEPVLRGKTIHRLTAEGRTVDETLLRGGETIAVGRRPQSSVTESLRLVSIVVSIAGGLYGLSRAIR